MLTVHCVLWGEKYDHYSVQRLQRDVAENLTIPHRFQCLTDQEVEGVEIHPQVEDWPGWWQKVSLFAPGVSTEQNLYIDLDCVILDSLDDMVRDYADENFSSANNWAQSGHGGIQSSVMLWKGGPGCHAEWIWRYFDPEIAHWPPINQPPILWGDQEWMTKLRSDGVLSHTPIPPPLIQSYKYHVRPTHQPPDGCKIVVFHGDPKPSVVRESWFAW